MIFCFILLIFLTILQLFGIFGTFRDKEYGGTVFFCLMTVLCVIMLCGIIDAMKRQNEQVVEYYFPADHYKIEQIVTVRNEKSDIGSNTLVTTKCDTTYRITGIEPIVWKNNHYDRKYYTKEEYDNR